MIPNSSLVLMQISVCYFTNLREVVGKREENIHFKKDDKVTVDTVLDALVERHGKPFAEYVFDSRTKEVKGFLQFLINGISISSFEGMHTRLRDGDVLSIIPPVGGG